MNLDQYKERLAIQAAIVAKRKQEEENQRNKALARALDKIVTKIEYGVGGNSPLVELTEYEYEISKDMLTPYYVEKMNLGNPMQHEEPRTVYYVHLK